MEISDYIASGMIYFLILIAVIGIAYEEDWYLLFYSIVFIIALWLLNYKIKYEIRKELKIS